MRCAGSTESFGRVLFLPLPCGRVGGPELGRIVTKYRTRLRQPHMIEPRRAYNSSWARRVES